MTTNKPIIFTIPIEPKAQMRVRFRRQGNFVRTHKTAKQEDNEAILMFHLDKNRPKTPLKGAIFLKLTAYMSIPASKPSWWREAAGMGIIKHITKPDVDNLAKNLLDCMTKMEYFGDDRQVISLSIDKKYSSERPRWEIELIEISQPVSKNDHDLNYRK